MSDIPSSDASEKKRNRSFRTETYARVAVLAAAAGLALTILSASGAESPQGRFGGDFPAFWGAGSIVADGDWDDLYDPARQFEAQQPLFDESEQGFLYFAYPPHVAALYRPFAAMDFRLAYSVHALLMLGVTALAIWLLRPLVPTVRRRPELAIWGSVLFYPLLRAITGGQNTAISLLLLVSTWRALDGDRDHVAGLLLGLLLFKPQLALPVLGLLLVARRWRAVATCVGTAAVLWAFGALVIGVDWLGGWWSQARWFAELDADVNGHNAVSWLGFAEGLFGAGDTLPMALAAPLMLATVAALLAVWLRGSLDLATRMSLTMLGIVMLSPHAMFYDAGLFVVPALVLIDRIGARAYLPLGLAWSVFWLQFFATAVGFAPAFIVIVATLPWLVKGLLADQGADQGRDAAPAVEVDASRRS